MTLRRLTDRQRERQKNQKKKTELTGQQKPGLLIAHHGSHAIIESNEGSLHHCHIRQHVDPLVTGDKVLWQELPDHSGVITLLCERKNILYRTATSKKRPIAANIDLLIIVVAPEPTLINSTLDSYLVMAGVYHLKPLIIFNKADLQTPDFLKKASLYQSLGYDYLHTSTYTHIGLDQLYEKLSNKNSLLLGPSGVGKSSLLQYFIPDLSIRTAKLCTLSNLGRHTTTVSRLYHLTQGDLIDSPGIRRFELWDLSPQQLAPYFIEFTPYLGHCEFRNCQHLNEKGCAILIAKEEGLIDPLRVASFHELLQR